ncbi:MAG: glycosyltransferase family 2 protein [Bacilli bacterium]|nr:glycosyltransferase family 2 protein [Bacilli bacterium]
MLSIVIPCSNEEEVLQETTKKLKSLISEKKISKNRKVMYVNDGSRDATWILIKKINGEEKLFTGISLSRNREYQNALLAGLIVAREYADVVISMDINLQDDVDVIDEMFKKYAEGNDIVYGVRNSRKKDILFKKTTTQDFYKFMHLMGVEIVFNHEDYRLTSKRFLNDLETFKGVNLFLRGIFSLIDYKSDVVYYERSKRF